MTAAPPKAALRLPTSSSLTRSVVAIAGHIFSGATAAAMPIYEKARHPDDVPLRDQPGLTTTGSKVFNRVAFTDAAQGKFAAEYLYNTLGFKKIAVMHDGQSYGQGLAEVVTEHFTELGRRGGCDQAITPGETDYSAPLSAVLQPRNPRPSTTVVTCRKQSSWSTRWAQSGLHGVIFFGCDGTFGEDFIDRTAANGEGAYRCGA